MTPVLVAVAACAVTLVTTPVVMRVAVRTGVVDRPGPLKRQSHPVPYLGGIAVLLGAVVGAAVGRPVTIVPLSLALALGVWDDAADLSPTVRLLGQVAVGGTLAAVLPVRFAAGLGPLLVIAVTVVLMNGVNLLDGLDVLATGVVGTACIGFGVVLHDGGRLLAIALASAAIGFVAFNRPPARVYLGDGGAYLLGAALAALVTLAWARGTRSAVGVAALILVAVPVAEVAFAVMRRIRAHESLVGGDRGHPYDRLVARGWPPIYASLAYIAAQAACVGLGVLVSRSRSLEVPVVAAVVLGLALLASAVVDSVVANRTGPRT